MTDQCLCNSIPAKRRGEVRSPQGELVMTFHLDCPEHGIKVSEPTPMREVFKLQWMTRQQLAGLATLTRCRVKQKHPDKVHALVEYVDYEFITTEEDKNGQGDTAQAAE